MVIRLGPFECLQQSINDNAQRYIEEESIDIEDIEEENNVRNDEPIERIEMRVAMLPIDQKEQDIEIRRNRTERSNIIGENFEGEEIDSDELCEVCERATDEINIEEYNNILQMERVLYRERPDEMIFSLMAERYNKSFYEPDQKLAGKRKIKKWTTSMVRQHFKGEYRHDRTHQKRSITEQIDFLDRCLIHLRKNGMWKQQYLDEGPIGPIFPDKIACETYQRLAKLQLDFYAFSYKIDQEEKKHSKNIIQSRMKSIPRGVNNRSKSMSQSFPTY